MLKALSFVCFLPGVVFATTLSNHIQGVGPHGNIKPYICIPKSRLKIAPGASIDVGQVDYVGATLRFNGCEGN